MATQKLVAVKEFCRHHKIDLEFIQSLRRNEMIELVMIKRTSFIAEDDLQSLEKAVRLYHELDINIEGIQTILHLLSSLEKKENELMTLRNQLGFYVSPHAG